MTRARVIAAALALVTMATVAAGIAFGTPELLAAWRMAITLVGGIAVGALMLLAIGQLLDNDWHEAIRDELLPMSLTLPVVAVLAAPLLLLSPAPPEVFFGQAVDPVRAGWFAPDARRLRLAIIIACWLGSVALIARRNNDHRASAVALALTTVAALLAWTDWIMVSQPLWWSKLLPFCVTVGQLLAALSVAFILNLAQRETLERPHHRSLASGLLALALLATWVWYAQYLTAWNGNLPQEARWYLSRMAASGWALQAALVCQAIGTAILLFLQRRRTALLSAAVLLLIAYCAHGYWLLRPEEVEAARAVDLAILGAMALLWAGWLAAIARIHDRRVASTGADEPDSRAIN